MLLLFETALGYAIFKVNDENKLSQVKDFSKAFKDTTFMHQMINLEGFTKFDGIKDSLTAASALVEGKLSKKLKKLLKKLYVKEIRDDVLAVADKKLSREIHSKFKIATETNRQIQELMRGIRAHMESLLPELDKTELLTAQLSLAHSLSRHKIKYNPNKIDTMIVQAIGLMDELDKECNNYVMRCKEMYGWHFPELSKIVTDNMTYIKLVRRIGVRENAVKMDLTDILPDDLISKVKDATIISIGTELTEEDVEMIHMVCDQVKDVSDSRDILREYLEKRMVAVAPNLTALVGEILGARLIAKAGTLINLAKRSASTVQILGAEKALFRALKARHHTPKYGLLYHASLVGQAGVNLKGKISRMLAAKASLAIRLDAFGEEDADNELGIRALAYLENRLRQLEAGTFNPGISRKRKSESTNMVGPSKRMAV